MGIPVWIRMIAVLGVIAVFALPANGGTLREDYRNFVMKRQTLEKERSQYQARINTLKSEQRKLTLKLYKCVVKSKKKELTQQLDGAQAESDRLEEIRRGLNGLRQDLGKLREALEEERASIERRHRRKGPGSDYEKEFRAYMKRLGQEYFQAIQEKLFTGYEEYIAGISSHIAALLKEIRACEESGGPP